MVFSHSFALTGFTEPYIGTASMGALGVWTFFILSGYLISASWEQYPRFNVFFAKRALRIFPGLIVAVFGTVLVTGVFFSNIGLRHFFTNPETLGYLNNIFLVNMQYTLPGGVFIHNPYPSSVNGSLWTLAYEFLMYLAVAIFGVVGIYKKISIDKIWLGLFITELIINLVGIRHFSFILFYFQFNLLVTFALMFFTGVLVQKKAKLFKFVPRYGILSLVLFVVAVVLIPKLSELAAATLLAYSLFAFGSSDRMSWFDKFGDCSYGIYIYSFPIQQMIVATTMTTNPYKLFALAFPLSVLIGALSWWTVESKMLKHKKKINIKKYPLLQPETAW